MAAPFRLNMLMALAAGSFVGACAGGAGLQVGSIGSDASAPESVVEVYSRIARGARACWFAASGPLKKTHIFHADVEPASSGGGAEITIHERDPTQPSPWGKRAFRIQVKKADGDVQIATENLALPDDLAGRMRADVLQWRDGGSSCLTASTDATGRVAPLPVNRWREPALPPGAP